MTLIAAIIIFLFSLFLLSKDDFVLLRKSVPVTTVFDMAFFVGISSLLLSRIVYVATHFSTSYLNPLVFLVIPYFPGLSGAGLLLGGSCMLYALTKSRKFPTGKLFDVFSLALLPAVAFFFFEQAVISLVGKHVLTGVVMGVSGLVLFCLLFILQKAATRLAWRDGSMSFGALFGTALVYALLTLVPFPVHSIPQEFFYFLFFLFLLFISFLIMMLRRTQ